MGRSKTPDEEIRAYGELVDQLRAGGMRKEDSLKRAMIELGYEWSSPSTKYEWFARSRKLPAREASSQPSAETGSWRRLPEAIAHAGDFDNLVKMLLADVALATADIFRGDPEGGPPPKGNIIPREWWENVQAHGLDYVTFVREVVLLAFTHSDATVTAVITTKAIGIKIRFIE